MSQLKTTNEVRLTTKNYLLSSIELIIVAKLPPHLNPEATSPTSLIKISLNILNH